MKELGEASLKCVAGNRCPAQLKGAIKHFVSRKALNIEGLGEQIINQLVDKQLINSQADLFYLSKEDFLTLDKIAAKSADNLIQAIDKVKNRVLLSKLIYALGIREVGQVTANHLAAAFSTLKSLKAAGYDELTQLEDVGPTMAKNIIGYFKSSENLYLIQRLEQAHLKIIYTPVLNKTNNSKFLHKTVVITGSFSLPRDIISARLEELGAKITSTVSKKTDYLLIGDKPGSKVKKAEKLGVSILNMKDLVDIVK